MNTYLTNEAFAYMLSSVSYTLSYKNRPSFLELERPKFILTSWGLRQHLSKEKTYFSGEMLEFSQLCGQ